jgi:hypothetical protein
MLRLVGADTRTKSGQRDALILSEAHSDKMAKR